MGTNDFFNRNSNSSSNSNLNDMFSKRGNQNSFNNGQDQVEYNEYGYIERSESEVITFVKDTYKLFAGGMLVGTAGAYIGVGMAGTIAKFFWLFVILEIGLLIGIHFVKHTKPLNLIVLFGFTFVSGLTLGPILYKFLGMAGGATIIANAFAMTTVIFGGLSIFAINSKSDFTSYGKPLMIALLVVIAGSIVNIFLGSPILHIIIQGAVVLLFSFFIIFDTQNIIRGQYETPIDGAVALYLDFFNLFTALLQILGIMSSDD